MLRQVFFKNSLTKCRGTDIIVEKVMIKRALCQRLQRASGWCELAAETRKSMTFEPSVRAVRGRALRVLRVKKQELSDSVSGIILMQFEWYRGFILVSKQGFGTFYFLLPY